MLCTHTCTIHGHINAYNWQVYCPKPVFIAQKSRILKRVRQCILLVTAGYLVILGFLQNLQFPKLTQLESKIKFNSCNRYV